MLARLFLLLLFTFFAELFLLLWLADKFGWQIVLAEIFLSGILGVFVTRWQNVKTFRRVQSQLAAGEVPATSILHGMLVLAAGVLLILPGILTDILGLLLLVPLFRKLLGLSVAMWFHRRFRTSAFGANNFADAQQRPHLPEQQAPRIIDVQVIEKPKSDSQSES
jgi:UPF0716 protein FxsA